MTRNFVALALLLCTVAGAASPDAADDEVVLMQTHRQVSKRDAPSVQQQQTSWHPIGDWGFTADFAQESTIREFEAWDSEHGWSSVRPGLNLSDRTQWPPIAPCAGGWRFGLHDPQIAVISMAKRVARRVQFKKTFDSLCINETVEWAPAMDGGKMPPATIWLRGPDQSTWSHDGDSDKPGAWGCFLTHFAVLQQFHERCAECDVVVFEDDIVFSPDFRKQWRQFFQALPEDWDIIRLGAQSLWAAPLEVARSHYKVAQMSNTWGYILRAKCVKEVIDFLATIPVGGAWGIDAMFNLLEGRFGSFAPRVPLLYGNSFCHDSEHDSGIDNCETVTGLEQASQKLRDQWPLDYYHTFCKGYGQPDEQNRQSPGCKNSLFALSCCPRHGMQNPPPTGKVATL